jgi:hypothetical protein
LWGRVRTYATKDICAVILLRIHNIHLKIHILGENVVARLNGGGRAEGYRY